MTNHYSHQHGQEQYYIYVSSWLKPGSNCSPPQVSDSVGSCYTVTVLQPELECEESECQICKPWFSFVVRTKTLDIEAWTGSMTYATYKYCKEVES